MYFIAKENIDRDNNNNKEDNKMLQTSEGENNHKDSNK